MWFWKGCGDGEAGGCKAIPPVVAQIFSGDSTSPLTREARTWCGARDGCGFERVVWMADVWGWWAGGDGDRFTEKREVLLR